MLESKSIMFQLPVVVAESLFIQIPEQVEWFNADIGSLQTSLQETPIVFETVRVNLAVYVCFRVMKGYSASCCRVVSTGTPRKDAAFTAQFSSPPL